MQNNNLPPMALLPNQSSLPPITTPLVVAESGEASTRLELYDYIAILMKRKWWIIGTFFVIFSSMAIYVTCCTRIYRSTTTLQITKDNPGSDVSSGDKIHSLGGPDPSEKFQNTQYKILKSYSLGERIVSSLKLKDYPIYNKFSEDSLAKLISSQIEIAPIASSYLVEVSFQSPDKSLAQRVANSIADEYMYLSIDRRNESFALVGKWLDKQLQQMTHKVELSQQKLYRFGQKTNIYSLEDKDNVIIQKFTDLSSLLTKAQADTLAKRAQYQQIKEKGPDAPLIVNNGMIAALRQQIVTQQAKLSSLRKIYRREHPEILAEQATLIELQSRMRAEVQRLQGSIKADYETSLRAEKLIDHSLLAQKGKVAKLQDNLSNYQILKRDAQTNEQLYQALLARVKEANIASTMVPTNIAIVDPARLPIAPFKPQTKKLLTIAATIGLALGVVLALVIEMIDDSIKSIDDMEKYCKIPLLGVLPEIPNSNGKASLNLEKKSILQRLSDLRRNRTFVRKNTELGLTMHHEPDSMFSEAIRNIYSSLMLSSSGKPPSVIMACSPNPDEGKSTVISNIAQFCAQNERSAIIIDCDLRKPTLHNIFKIGLQPGLSNYLSGGASLEEIIHTSSLSPNLAIITAGVRPPNPIALINSKTFEELLMQLRGQYHHIFIDTPPVLCFADARFMSVLVDGIIIVVKSNKTNKYSANQTQLVFSQIHAPLFGSVLNSVKTTRWQYGSYNYYYKYYSKYYRNDNT